jgi:hypothetical protein
MPTSFQLRHECDGFRDSQDVEKVAPKTRKTSDVKGET